MRGRVSVRALKIAGSVFGLLAIIAMLGFGALIIRLGQGPIEADGLGERIAAALNRRFDNGVQFSFGATRIARTEHGPTIVVDHLLAVAAGRTVVEAPRAEVSLDPLALLRFEALPNRLEAFDLTVRLLVMPDGALAISAGGGAEEAIILSRPSLPDQPTEAEDGAKDQKDGAKSRPRRSAVLRDAAGALRAFFDLATSPKSPLAALHSVAVRGGNLVVDDRTADRTTVFNQLEMAFEKRWRASVFTLAANSPNGKLTANARATGTPDSERQLDIEVRDVSMDEIALIAGMRRPLVESDAALSFKLRFILDANRELREASGRAVVGAGFLRLEDPDHEPIFFDEISGGFHWDPARRRIVLDPFQYFGGETQFTAGGALDPPARAGEGWRLVAGLTKPGGLAPERPNEKLLQIEKASIDARIFIEEKRVVFDRAEMSGPEVSLAAAGDFDWIDGPHIRLGATAGQMPMRALFRLWPTHMGAPARTWLIAHAPGGTVKSGNIAIDFDRDALLAMRFDRPPPNDSLRVDFQVANGAISPMPGIPTVNGIEGAGRVTGRTVVFNGSAGVMDTGGGRRLTLSNGTFSMPNNDGSRALSARLDVRAVGSVEAVADLLAKEPINTYASLPLEPGTLRGQVDGRLGLDFKVGPDAAGADIKVSVNANVANFVADKLLGKEKFEAPSLAVVGDPGGIRATGAGRIFGSAASLDLRKGIGQPAVANLTAVIDEAARARLGVTASGIAGPMSVKLAATLDRETKAAVEVDLTRVGLDNPIPGLVKSAGRPGKATFTILQRENLVKVEDFAFEAGGASARGQIELNGQGEFVGARFTQARLSPGDDMRVDVTRAGETMKTVVRGPSIDARPFLKSITQASEADSGKEREDIEVDVKTPILTGYGKQALTNAELRISRKNGALRQFAMSGQFGRSNFVAALARGENGQPQVNISTSDGGALLAFADLYSRMEGGALTASMQFADRTVAGMLSIRSFHLRDEPALRRLVLEGNPRVDPSSGVRVDPSLVRFDRLQVVFSRAGGKLTLRDGVMNGPNIGLTVEGLVDEDRQTMALNGTFVPAYTVNNFFSKIPVVGLILGGGWNEGLFAVNYKVTGRPSNPQISINPLSVAPGFLRKIFGAMDNATTAPPTR